MQKRKDRHEQSGGQSGASGDVRLQKYLAERGVCARRVAAELIRAGRITVNGAPQQVPGFRIKPGKDRVCFDGKDILADKPPQRTFLFYKPRGYICTSVAAEGRSIYELLPRTAGRLLYVGRLDKDSEGLLLLTTDGALAQQLSHPRYEHEKEYRVTVAGDFDRQTLASLRSPLEEDGYHTRPALVEKIKTDEKTKRHVLRLVLREGRNRQVRRLCERAGLRVCRLVRERIGNCRYKGLKPGAWRELTEADIKKLMGKGRPEQANR